MTPRSAERSAVAVAVAALPADCTRFVGIDGFGGAGKSTLAAELAAAVPGTAIVHVDDFWGPGIAEWDWDRFGRQLLLPLLAGRRARYQIWDWDLDRGGRWQDVEPGQLIVVEGVSCTRTEAGVPWDLAVWVQAPRDVRLARALERDGPDLMPRWLADWMPSEEAYVRRQRPMDRVDFLVDGTR